MKTCVKCNKEIENTKKCEHCGKNNPTVGLGTNLGTLVFLVGGAFYFFYSVDSDYQEKNKSVYDDFTEVACNDNYECLAWKNQQVIIEKCQIAITNQARYRDEWLTPERPFFQVIKWADKDKKQISFFGDAVKLQNGFGAWQNYKYQCDFDINSKSVINLNIEQGRL